MPLARTWLSLDLINKTTTEEKAYCFIGNVLARLAPADAAVLVDPAQLSTQRFDIGILRQLANGRHDNCN